MGYDTLQTQGSWWG